MCTHHIGNQCAYGPDLLYFSWAASAHRGSHFRAGSFVSSEEAFTIRQPAQAPALSTPFLFVIPLVWVACLTTTIYKSTMSGIFIPIGPSQLAGAIVSCSTTASGSYLTNVPMSRPSISLRFWRPWLLLQYSSEVPGWLSA